MRGCCGEARSDVPMSPAGRDQEAPVCARGLGSEAWNGSRRTRMALQVVSGVTRCRSWSPAGCCTASIAWNAWWLRVAWAGCTRGTRWRELGAWPSRNWMPPARFPRRTSPSSSVSMNSSVLCPMWDWRGRSTSSRRVGATTWWRNLSRAARSRSTSMRRDGSPWTRRSPSSSRCSSCSSTCTSRASSIAISSRTTSSCSPAPRTARSSRLSFLT